MSVRLMVVLALIILLGFLWWRVRQVQHAVRADGRNVTAADVLELLLGAIKTGLLLASALVLISAWSYWSSQNALEGEAEISAQQCETTRAQLEAARAFRDADVRSFELAVMDSVARVRLLERRQDHLEEADLSAGGSAYVAQWLADDLSLARSEAVTNRAELRDRLVRRDEIMAIPLPECPPDPDEIEEP